MEYRGRNIPDEIPKTTRTGITQLRGDDTSCDIRLSKDELSIFIDTLSSTRDSMDELERAGKSVEVEFLVFEGYEGECQIDKSYPSMHVFLETSEPEPEDEKSERIEKEKYEIDESIRILEETEKRRKEKNVRDAIEFLEKNGYKVHK